MIFNGTLTLIVSTRGMAVPLIKQFRDGVCGTEEEWVCLCGPKGNESQNDSKVA